MQQDLPDPHPVIRHPIVNAASVPIGADARQIVTQEQAKDYPYCSVVFLINKDQYIYGTGAFLQNSETHRCRHIITCAHNFVIEESKGNWKEYYTKKEDWKHYYFHYRRSRNQKEKENLTKPEDQMKIKNVYLHPEYYDREVGKVNEDIFSPSYDRTKPKDYNTYNINDQNFYDVAVIELQEEIDVLGYYIWPSQITLEELPKESIESIELTGFPYHNQTKNPDQYSLGVMKKQRVFDKLKIKKLEEIFYYIGDGRRQIIRHTLSSEGGNSGSPIYFASKGQAILLGVHTMGNGVKDLGNNEWNSATSIYWSEVYNWLKGIKSEGFDKVFSK